MGYLLLLWSYCLTDIYPSASLLALTLFPLTLLALSALSTTSSPTWLYILVTGLNGLATGAAANYTLAHLLHLTSPSTHYIATSLLATFRGFAGSFGSAIGGGIFSRSLQSELNKRFKAAGLQDKEQLIRRLMGSPALVKSLQGVEREVAVQGYVVALRALFLAGVGLGALMVIVQAGTALGAPPSEVDEADEVDRDGVEPTGGQI